MNKYLPMKCLFINTYINNLYSNKKIILGGAIKQYILAYNKKLANLDPIVYAYSSSILVILGQLSCHKFCSFYTYT